MCGYLVALQLSGRLKEYAGFSQPERTTKQAAAHMLGELAHKKIALNLDPTGETPWGVIRLAGGSTAFAGKTQVQRDALLATGRKKQCEDLDRVGKNVAYANTRVAAQPIRLPRSKEVGRLNDGYQATNSSCCGNGICWSLQLGGSLDDKEWCTLASSPE